jgi:putative two-component system response regulator
MGQAGKVLVVDDQPLNTEALVQALQPLGYEVWQALDGPTALLLAREHLPDVILLDLRMPGMDGFEVCRKLKADPETQLLPVVVLTGMDSRETRLAALEAGATDFLAKPFDLVELEVRVRNLVSYRRLIQDLDDAERMLFAVARAVEARDEGTGEHCDRLSHLAVWLGERLGLKDEDLKSLRRAGYLHDIGKIGIPDRILHKPGPLDPQEWVVMRSHVEIGVRICAPLRTLRPVLPIIRHHHERWDGSGYPDGLAGEAIPFLARVFQVVDVYDALTSDRPYRKALPPEEALAVLQQETAQGRWDPAVVEAFARGVREVGPEVLARLVGPKAKLE